MNDAEILGRRRKITIREGEGEKKGKREGRKEKRKEQKAR